MFGYPRKSECGFLITRSLGRMNTYSLAITLRLNLGASMQTNMSPAHSVTPGNLKVRSSIE